MDKKDEDDGHVNLVNVGANQQLVDLRLKWDRCTIEGLMSVLVWTLPAPSIQNSTKWHLSSLIPKMKCSGVI